MNEPSVNVTAFHKDERLYTLVMIDPGMFFSPKSFVVLMHFQ
jgi:hypothetical protein